MSKTLQVRMSDQEHALIKTAFAGENMSKFIRENLLKEAEKRLEEMDVVSVQTEDEDVRSFIEVLSKKEVQLKLYNIFKTINDDPGPEDTSNG